MFTFDRDKAESAGAGNYINKSGYYVATITEFKLNKSNDSQAETLAIKAVDNFDKSLTTKVMVKKKDGKDAFSAAQVHALMGITKVADAKPNFEGRFDCFEGKKVGFQVQREEYARKDGKVGYQLNLLHFMKPDTNQTFSEFTKGKPAKVYLDVIEDIKLADKPAAKTAAKTAVSNNSAAPADPFAPNSDGCPF